ncbi:MAG TPA: SGNH/GDSL hydrolase family protein [Gemmatimonadaceae bacterium]|nr:SGNH/GDSL hydrolase family protein [Gemmatimonadaceae bacterium]
MMRNKILAGGAAALLCSALLTACSDTKDLVTQPPPADPLFTSYVALGNSITAGYQSDGINDSTQQQSYANLLAQRMGTPFVMPLLAKPGCKPPIDTFTTQHRVGGGTNTTCALRSDVAGVPVINDVAVPGANVFDLTDAAGSAGNTLTTLILGGKTQVQRALDANPTFVSAWIGNNDVLGPALAGVLVAVPNVSRGVTSEANFEKYYAKAISGLQAAPSLRGGVLIGVVNVTGAPIFFSSDLLFSPQVKGAIDAVAGTTVTVDTSCTPGVGSLINFAVVGAIRAGTAPDTIACHAIQNHPQLLGQLYVLDATEVAAVTNAVNGYNAYIQAKADSLGWAYVDPNPALAQLRANNLIPPFPDLANPTKPFGDYISLDGVHPAAAAHQLVAGMIAAAIDAKYGTHIGGGTP